MIGRQFSFETEHLPFEKKTGPGQIRTQSLYRPRHISYLQAKLPGNAKKFEYIMKHGRDESWEHSCLRENSLVLDCNYVAYRKGKKLSKLKFIQVLCGIL